MAQKFQSLDELFRADEERMLAEARARAPAEAASYQRRNEEEKARRATIPVWVGHEDVVYGPFANDDAAENFVEDKKWPFNDCTFRNYEQEVKDALEEAKREDDDEEEDDE